MDDELIISGCSDDLIELDGVIVDEIPATQTDKTYLKVTPDYIVEADYTLNGKWVFDVVEEPEEANYEIKDIGENDDCKPYSGCVIIKNQNEDVEVTKVERKNLNL